MFQCIIIFLFKVSSVNSQSKKKLILFWNDVYRYKNPDKDIMFWDGLFRWCPNARCTASDERKYVHEAAAVIYSFMPIRFDWSDVPSVRYDFQRYVFFTFESPVMTFADLDGLKNFFNWTMTYRMDSDVPFLYGRVKYIDSYVNKTTLSIAAVSKMRRKRKRLIAWMASNCIAFSKREMIVAEMQKYLQIDVFGMCGNLTCDSGDIHARNYSRASEFVTKKEYLSCLKLFNKHYKFLISFENSICMDYVTEKFWRALDLKIIPVVMSRKVYETVAPPNSFIAADDFDSVEKLSSYILSVSKNDELYASYLNWMNKGYRLIKEPLVHLHRLPITLCRLCENLWTKPGHKTKYRKSYASLKAWFEVESHCESTFSIAKRILHGSKNPVKAL